MADASPPPCDTLLHGGKEKPTTPNQDSTIWITQPVASSFFNHSLRGTLTDRSSMIAPIWTALLLGFLIIPLKNKRPVIPWKSLQATGLPLSARQRLVLNHKDAEAWGVVTGPSSGVMVIDLDLPLNEDATHALRDYPYVTTQSGGRHYYFRYREEMHHGLGVIPRVDIPHIARFYGLPEIIDAPLPFNGHPSDPYVPNLTFEDSDPPSMNDLDQCSFIHWFREQRDQPWDGRYPVARAYASNVKWVTDPDLSLGEGYRHTQQIYENIGMPITCLQIDKHYKCPFMHPYTGICQKSGAATPYGLARRQHEKDRLSKRIPAVGD